MTDPFRPPVRGRHRLAPSRHRFACPPRARRRLGVRGPAAAVSVVAVAVALALAPSTAGSPSGSLPVAGAVWPWLAPAVAEAAEPEGLRAAVPLRVSRSTPDRPQAPTVDDRRPEPPLRPHPTGGPPAMDDRPSGPPTTTQPPAPRPELDPEPEPEPTEDAHPGPTPVPDDTPDPSPEPTPPACGSTT